MKVPLDNLTTVSKLKIEFDPSIRQCLTQYGDIHGKYISIDNLRAPDKAINTTFCHSPIPKSIDKSISGDCLRKSI